MTDSSVIITWLTPAYGTIKTVAKGARRPHSRFAGLLDLFFTCEINFARSKRSDLHTLREVVLRDPSEGLRAQHGRVAVAAYFVELIELVTEPEHAAPELYDLCLRAFGYLNEHAASRRPLLHFETELARLLGIRDERVTAAVAIGRAYQHLPAGRAALVRSLPEKESAPTTPSSGA